MKESIVRLTTLLVLCFLVGIELLLVDHSGRDKGGAGTSQRKTTASNQTIDTVNNATASVTVASSSLAEGLPQDLRICRIDPPPILNTTPVVQKESLGIPLWYQCTGEPYDDFMNKVFQLILERYQKDQKEQWGRRPAILPLSVHNKSILIMGNSHTRQMAASLLCQYRDLIQDQKELVVMTDPRHVAVSFQFIHNVTITVIANHPFVYSQQWVHNLERDILNHPLSDLDAIVLGKFNGYQQSQNSTFLASTLEYQEQFPHQKIDFAHIPPPRIQEVASAYNGPLVWVGMFALYNEQRHQEALRMIRNLRKDGRTNLHSVDGRKYIKRLGDECSSNIGNMVSTCQTDRKAWSYSNGHRCVGDKGGEPDLIAWDVVETLHEIFGGTAGI